MNSLPWRCLCSTSSSQFCRVKPTICFICSAVSSTGRVFDIEPYFDERHSMCPTYRRDIALSTQAVVWPALSRLHCPTTAENRPSIVGVTSALVDSPNPDVFPCPNAASASTRAGNLLQAGFSDRFLNSSHDGVEGNSLRISTEVCVPDTEALLARGVWLPSIASSLDNEQWTWSAQLIGRRFAELWASVSWLE